MYWWWFALAIGSILFALAYGVYFYILLPHYAPPSYHAWQDQSNAQISIGSTTICARVALSATTQQKGLSGVASLDAHSGMLFIFPTAGKFSFWMKGMLIPLDFIWMRDGHIIDLTPNVLAPTSLFDFHITTPSSPADMVLEVPTGTIAQNNIHIGDDAIITANSACVPIITPKKTP